MTESQIVEKAYRIQRFDSLVDKASKIHALAWCVKRQLAIPTFGLSGDECCNCEQFVLNKGVCDPL